MPDSKYDVIQTPAMLLAVGEWYKELDPIEWGDRKAKYDIRGWNKDRSEIIKGTTLSKEEMEYLKESIGGIEI